MKTAKEIACLICSLAVAVLIFAVLYAGIHVVINLFTGVPLTTNL